MTIPPTIPPTLPRTAPRSRRSRPTFRHTSIIVAAVLVAAAAAAAAALLPGRNLIAGLPDAGPVVSVLLPITRAGFRLCGALTVGWLLTAAWLAPPQRSGVLDVAGYRAIRAASYSAAAWAACAVILLPLTVLDVAGRPVSFLLTYPDRLLVALGALDAAQGIAITAVLAALVAGAARIVLRPGGAWWLLAVTGVALLPQTVTGHSSSDRDHDFAVDGMIWHLLGLSVWIGGLVAVLVLAGHRTPGLPTIVRRYSTLAMTGFAAVLVSGVGNTILRLPAVGDLFTTTWGQLIVAKTALLVVVFALGAVHRRRTLPALTAGRPGAFTRLAAAEITVLAAILGLGVALGRTAPPPADEQVQPLSDAQRVLGFDLPGPPTPLTLITGWRMDWLLGGAAIALAVAYLVGLRRLRRRGVPWPWHRTAAWLTGCVTLLVATSSGVGRYAEAQFSVHMGAHMLLGMTVPALLVLGAPITLAFRVLPTAPRGAPPGAREMLVAALHSRAARIITHPLLVLAVFIASLPAVYFSPLFAFLVSTHLGHLAMNVHYVLVGYLYYSLVIGVDPMPRQLPFIAKFALLMAPIPFHSFFGIAMMMTATPRAVDYYTSLALPWVPDLADDQRLGGAIAWAAVEAPLAIVVFALIAQWSASDQREARRADRRGHSRSDDELDAYNRMLAVLSERDRERDRAPSPPGPGDPTTDRTAVPTPAPTAAGVAAVIPPQPRRQGPS